MEDYRLVTSACRVGLFNRRTRLIQSLFSRRAVEHWNKLPTEIASDTSLRSLKTSLDSLFIEKGIAFQHQVIGVNH